MAKKIVVLSASWHTSIVESAETAFIEAMIAGGIAKGDIQVVKVPGALEIPLAGKLALENGADMAVGIGFVVDGGIYHFEYVAHSVVQSILDVSIETRKPFLSVVLAPQDFKEDSKRHEAWFINHMVIKGQEAATAALRMLEIPSEILAKHKNKAA